MRLEAVSVHGFRSLGRVSLNKVGELNVLIGRNNTGKSSILLAIETCFRVFSECQPVTSRVVVNENIFSMSRSTSCDIRLTFLLNDNERRKIVHSASQDSGNTGTEFAELFKSSPLLTIAITTKKGLDFWYTSAVSIGGGVENSMYTAKEIVNISDKTAIELWSRNSDFEELDNKWNEIKRLLNMLQDQRFGRIFLEDDAIGLLLKDEEIRSAVNVAAPTIGPEFWELLFQNKNLEIVRELLSQRGNELKGEAAQVLSSKLRSGISVLNGTVNKVPPFLNTILHLLSSYSVRYITDSRDEIGHAEAEMLLDWMVTRAGKHKLNRFRKIVNDVLGVDVDVYRSRDDTSPPDDSAELDVDQFLYDVNGAGIRRAVRLIYDLEADSHNLVLLEEPEVHLHPSLEVSLLQYLKEYSERCQVIMTTHSTNFVDAVGSHSVYLVKKSAETEVQSLSVDEFAEKISSQMGVRLSSVFMYNKLVFVEGPTDEVVLRVLSEKLGRPLVGRDIGFVKMGGVRNFGYFANAEALRFLAARNVELHFVIDRDERSDDEIDAMRRGLQSYAELHVWGRRQIENYLLVPKAISELILEKANKGGQILKNPVGEEDVRMLLSSAADSNKEFAVCKSVTKRLRDRYFVDWSCLSDDSPESLFESAAELMRSRSESFASIRDFAESVYREVLARYESVWETERLGIVSGDVLLQSVCKAFGVAFRKGDDSVRLAKLLTEDDIDGDVKKVIDKILAVRLA